MEANLTPNDRHNLSHNLTREWVTERLAQIRRIRASVQAEWVSEGIAFPQTSGEHDDPTGKEPPDFVDVFVTVPSGIDQETIDQLTAYLRNEAESDPRFGGRFGAAHLDEAPPEVERVESLDQGSNARRLTYRFSVQDPSGPSAE